MALPIRLVTVVASCLVSAVALTSGCSSDDPQGTAGAGPEMDGSSLDGRAGGSGDSSVDGAVEVPTEWQWVYEDFEDDFLTSGEDPNSWEAEGRTSLSILQNPSSTHGQGDNRGYLRVAAPSGDVAMIKKPNVRGGNLPKTDTWFYLQVADLPSSSATETSIAAFRDLADANIGFLRLIRQDSGHFQVTLRYNSVNAPASIGMSTGVWYRVRFSYDAEAAQQLTLHVESTDGASVGDVAMASGQSGVQTFLYGKVTYDDMEVTLLVDDLTIAVPAIADLWVSLNGSDTNVGSTHAEPVKTINRASSMAGPGTTIHILGGTYSEQVMIHYPGLNPSGARMTMRGEGALGEAVIDGTGIDISTDWGGLVHVSRTSRVVIENLTIANSESAGVFIQDSDGVEVSHVKTQLTQMSGVYAGDSSNISIHDVEVDRGCQLDSSTVAAQENISLKTVSGFDVHDNQVHGGPSHDNGGEGICVKGYSAYGRIHHNRVYDLPNDVGIYIGVGSEAATTTHHVLVFQNDVSADAGIAVSSEYGGTVEDIDIFNNVVHDGAYGGIQVTKWRNDPSQTGAIGLRRRIRIFNNTVYGVGAGGVGGGVHVQCDDAARMEGIEIRNNLLSQNFSGQLVVPEAVFGVVVASHNLLFGQGGVSADSAFCSNCIQADPGCVGTGSDPYDLQDGSAAIDRGCAVEVDLEFDGSLTPLAFDYLGRLRPTDGLAAGVPSYDIGAYERP